MQNVKRHAMRDQDYIFELHEMLRRNFPMDKIADWMAIHGLRHSNQAVKKTFKKAGREDLIEYFIKEEDIKVGDTIRSRMTGRFGKVIGINKDGDTIKVRWDVGGSQLLSKESVFKMREGDISDTSDLTKVKSVYDDYGDIGKKKK